MKKALALIAGMAAVAAVAAAQNIFVVDMARAYQNYYKAKTAFAQIQASADNAKKEIQEMAKKRDAIVKELNAVQEKVKNPALSEDAKKKIMETEFQPKYVEASRIENAMRDMQQQTTQRLQNNMNNVRQVHLQEIAEVIKQLAAEKKADFILERNACPFFKESVDITEDLIKAINANAPAAQLTPEKK
ncbi:MAG: hypothetical protein DBX55_07570 [Verrucomicrobia bacterium]|nr:MAG: hypothetical protein DBX55_07570 [Verrucomicrobiota bacterium]